MKAIILTAAGGPDVLEMQERPAPEPGHQQVRIRVHASALNRADLHQREGNYPAPPGSPADIPGMEYAGEIDAVGPGAALWKAGDRVMGIVGGGAHAELLTAHEREVMAMPAGMSYENAAAIPEVFLTAYDALFARLGVQVGERVIVHAVGSGVGTAALQLARHAGAIVIGTSRTADKLARAQAMGLTHAVDVSKGDWATQVESLVGTNGVHAIVDLVGGDYLKGNLRVLAPRGRMLVVGLTAGRTSEINLGMVLGKRLTIVGTMLRGRPLEEKIALAREFSSRIVPLFESGVLQPVVDEVVPFARIRDAHARLAGGDTFGKLVLTWELSS
jgi:putative PIG3 family NAD(P)H quinone oxidoreductase